MLVVRMSNISLFILLGIVLLILVALYIFVFNKKSSSSSQEIPRIIWSFWDSEEIPSIIKKCTDTWYAKNPNYEIRILNMNNIHKYLHNYEIYSIKNWEYNDSPQRLSDLVRLHVLSKYGGIWLDASIVCYENFDWIYEEKSDCLLYSIPELSTVPLLESWFIACTPNNPYVNDWKDEFMSVEKFNGIDEYVKDCNIDMTGINFPDYLLVYVCARKVYLKDPSRIKILNATTGPYNYHAQGGVSQLCRIQKPKFFKFRKEDRAALNDELMNCVFTTM
jgi:hypothetical protein